MKSSVAAFFISSTILSGCIKVNISDEPRCWQCTEVRTVQNYITHERYGPDSSASQVCGMTYRQKLVYEEGQGHYADYGQDSTVIFTTRCE